MSSPQKITLQALGWSADLEKAFGTYRQKQLVPARVVIEDKHHFVVNADAGVLTARLSGKLQHDTRRQAELPKVGDWVAISPVLAEKKALIHHVLPRQTRLSRKIPGRETSEHVLAANVATAFIVQALDQTFNPRLLERFILMVIDGGIRPVVLLNKADISEAVEQHRLEAVRCAGEEAVIVVSAKTGKGIKSLRALIRPQETTVFIGTSGVGKSSLINRLYGDEVIATDEVRESDSKGRHTTTWRELVVLPGGGLIIDTPGIREFHLWLAGDSIQDAFPDVLALSTGCRFRDCTHEAEKECAVKTAVQSGRLPEDRYKNYLRLKQELKNLEKHGRLYRRHKEGRRPRFDDVDAEDLKP